MSLASTVQIMCIVVGKKELDRKKLLGYYHLHGLSSRLYTISTYQLMAQILYCPYNIIITTQVVMKAFQIQQMITFECQYQQQVFEDVHIHGRRRTYQKIFSSGINKYVKRMNSSFQQGDITGQDKRWNIQNIFLLRTTISTAKRVSATFIATAATTVESTITTNASWGLTKSAATGIPASRELLKGGEECHESQGIR